MLKEKKILVVAPQFPAANQPWIDTYLEQLLINGFDVAIYSANRENGRYASKVDKLKLRERVLPFSLNVKEVRKGAWKGLLRSGGETLRAWSTAWALAEDLRSAIFCFVHGLHFAQADLKEIGLIHSHDEILAYKFLPLSLIRRVPLVLTFHGLPPSGIGQLASEKRHKLYKHASLVLVNTEFAKQQVCALGCVSEKVVVLPQGLCIDEFSFREREAPTKHERLHILTVGRYHRDKGQAYALLALRRLLARGLDVDWTFIGVGPDLARLRRWAKKLELADRVRFLVEMPQDEVKPFFHNCHLLVLPSTAGSGGWTETQGVVLQEAQASGCIPIASNVGGIPECVNDGRDALLVKQKSSRDLVSKIEFLLMNPDRWSSFQQAGRLNVVEKLSADVIGRKMAQLLIAQV